MIEALYIAETGMNSQQELIEVISNNIANVSTPGFKSSDVNFVDLVYQTNSGIDNMQASMQSKSHGIGVSSSEHMVNFERGDLKQTGNPFDIAINGKGFLAVETESGELAYTRAGRLRVDESGYLVTSQGHRLNANIQLPPDATNVTFTASGSVLVRVDSSTQLIEIGQLELTSFSNPHGLNRLGNNLYSASQDAGQPNFSSPGENGVGQIVQGFTELSNVSMNEEMVNLMLAQRGYQLNARIIQVSDQVLETINNLRR